MTVGLGTGSTVAYLLAPLADRGLSIRCVATSPATERRRARARALGRAVRRPRPARHRDRRRRPGGPRRLAGQGRRRRTRPREDRRRRGGAVRGDRRLRKAGRASSSPPVPLELSSFGLRATLRALGETELRDAPPSPDGGVLADYVAPVDAPGGARRAARGDAGRGRPRALPAGDGQRRVWSGAASGPRRSSWRHRRSQPPRRWSGTLRSSSRGRARAAGGCGGRSGAGMSAIGGLRGAGGSTGTWRGPGPSSASRSRARCSRRWTRGAS